MSVEPTRGLRPFPIEQFFVIDTNAAAPDDGVHYLHCSRCLEEHSEQFSHITSPRDYARTQIAITPSGLQVYCIRHNVNVAMLVLRGEVALAVDFMVERQRKKEEADRKRVAARKRS